MPSRPVRAVADTGEQNGERGMGATDDAAGMDQRAAKLRECAKDARAIARSLGPYLDDAVSKAAPRAGGAQDGGQAIWLGPYADQCTGTLKQRQAKLSSMASALMADATRWEGQAGRLEGDAKAARTQAKAEADAKAKAKANANATTGGH